MLLRSHIFNGEWVKKGALISMPSAARFDDEFLAKKCKLVVDNAKLYEAWEEEYPYPTYPQVQIVGTKFTDLVHDGLIQASDIIDITDVIQGKHAGRENDDEIIVYSVGGMPVEDIVMGRNGLPECPCKRHRREVAALGSAGNGITSGFCFDLRHLWERNAWSWHSSKA